MFAKHPLDHKLKELGKEDAVDALRLAIVAELDAISFYIQIARSLKDEGLRRLFEDVAREEKTHVGEFLEALKRLDPEQAKELLAGAREASELLAASGETSKGNEDNSNNGNRDPGNNDSFYSIVSETFKKGLKEARILRAFLPVVSVGDVDAITVYSSSKGRVLEQLLPLSTISMEFTIPAKLSERLARGDKSELGPILSAAHKFALREEDTILNSIRSTQGVYESRMGSWDEPGEAVKDIAEAYREVLSKTLAKNYLLLVSPSRYAKLLVFHERSGVMEFERIRRMLGNIVVHPLLGDNEAILLPLDESVIDIAVGVDTKIEHVGPERTGEQVFRVWESIALRVKQPEAIARLLSKS